MAAATFEGFIKDGEVRVNGSARLPDNPKVYIVVPDYEPQEVIIMPPLPSVIHLRTPRFVYEEGAERLGKVEMVEDKSDANV